MPRALRRLDNFNLPGDLGYLPQGAGESEVLFALIGERDKGRSLCITLNLVFSEWEKVSANSMTTNAALDQLVHHSAILDFDLPNYRTDAPLSPGPPNCHV